MCFSSSLIIYGIYVSELPLLYTRNWKQMREQISEQTLETNFCKLKSGASFRQTSLEQKSNWLKLGLWSAHSSHQGLEELKSSKD